MNVAWIEGVLIVSTGRSASSSTCIIARDQTDRTTNHAALDQLKLQYDSQRAATKITVRTAQFANKIRVAPRTH
jgi:hypothetical protein